MRIVRSHFSSEKTGTNMDDDDMEKMLNANPLMAFSGYTHIQVQELRRLGSEIIAYLDKIFLADGIDCRDINRYYGLFWLWVLGAYEVTRTMCQAKSNFSEELNKKLFSFKKNIALLRIPFAKLEYPGEHGNLIQNEASIIAHDREDKDFHFEVTGTRISVRVLINYFEELFSNIKRNEILKSRRG